MYFLSNEFMYFLYQWPKCYIFLFTYLPEVEHIVNAQKVVSKCTKDSPSQLWGTSIELHTCSIEWLLWNERTNGLQKHIYLLGYIHVGSIIRYTRHLLFVTSQNLVESLIIDIMQENRCISWYVSKHTTLNYCGILCKNLDISLIQQVEKIGYQKGRFLIKYNIDYTFLLASILVHIIETQISFWKQNIESGLTFGVFSLVLIMLNLCERWQDNKLNAEFLF